MAYTTVDLISAELKGLSITSTTSPSDTDVAEWITQADNEIDRRTSRVWSSTAFSSTIYDSDGSSYFRFPEVPIISVSSFEYETNGLGASSESWETLTEGRTNDFILYVNSGEIQYVNTIPSAGNQKLRISGIKGYANTPPIITHISTLMVAKRVVDATIQSNAQSGGGSRRSHRGSG